VAATIITNAVITINSVDLSAHISKVEISEEIEEHDTTNFASGGFVERIGGLGDATFTVDLFQDWASGAVNATISPIVGTVVPVKVKPTSGAISATNPEYQFNVTILEWTPLSAAVGEVPTVSVSWPISGVITVDITP